MANCLACDSPLVPALLGGCTIDCDAFRSRTRHIAPWPVSLGHAIASFCHRARVDALVREVGLAFGGTRADRVRGDAALVQLRELAIGGGK